MQNTPRKYELLYEVGPGCPTLPHAAAYEVPGYLSALLVIPICMIVTALRLVASYRTASGLLHFIQHVTTGGGGPRGGGCVRTFVVPRLSSPDSERRTAAAPGAPRWLHRGAPSRHLTAADVTVLRRRCAYVLSITPSILGILGSLV